jgi:hypothetical protein
MPKLNTKHANGNLMMFSDFTGGLNLSKPPESIEDNELAEAVNFEFAPDTGMLKARGGLAAVRTFGTIIDDIIPISGNNLFIKRGKYVDRYSLSTGTIQNTWDLSSGDDSYGKPAAYDFWGDSFQVVMAFGGHMWWSTEDGALEQIAGNGIAWAEEKEISNMKSNWQSVCYGNGSFVAVRYFATVMQAPIIFVSQSQDGATWTEHGRGNFAGLRSVCYGDSGFVAVGEHGQVATSADGSTWDLSTAIDADWRSVCYGNNLFVAVSYDGKCMTSPDGINWTQRTAVSGVWYSVCYGNSLFVAVGSAGAVMTSPNGTTWTQRNATAGLSLSSVCYGNGLFVASMTGGYVMTSPDGIVWTNRYTGVSVTWRSVCYGSGLFVIVGNNSKCATSTNGINWTERTATSGNWISVCYGRDRFVAVGQNGECMTAQDWGELPSKTEQIFIRDGRVFLTETDSDTLRASGVGDLANWRLDTDMDSISVDIGYKDGCDMRAIVEFAGEMIAFKAPPGRPDWGRIYRLQGKYPDWNIQLYTRGNSTWNTRSAVNIPNDVLFLSKGGMMSLGTVTEFGDFKLGWAGSKVNAALAPTLSDNCRMWHLPSKGQAWVSDGSGSDIWVYHYQLQAWTKFTFSGKVNAVFDDGNKTYIGIGNTLYVMSDATPCEKTAGLKLRTNIKRNQSLVKGIIAGYESGTGTAAKLKLGAYELALPYGGQLPDDTPNTGIVRARCNIRDWQVTPEISVTGGAFSLVSLGLEVAEV